jgi:DNA-directed RNA polymerase subunit RPC12/RpoP
MSGGGHCIDSGAPPPAVSHMSHPHGTHPDAPAAALVGRPAMIWNIFRSKKPEIIDGDYLLEKQEFGCGDCGKKMLGKQLLIKPLRCPFCNGKSIHRRVKTKAELIAALRDIRENAQAPAVHR